MKFCPNCGTKLELESKFCPACGVPIASVHPPFAEPSIPSPQIPRQQDPIYQQTREAAHSFSEAISGKTNLILRVINILSRPAQEWYVVAKEQPNTMRLIGGYAFVLALIPAISGFIKYGILGVSFMGFANQSIAAGIQTGLVQLFSAIIGVCLLALVIDILAPSFDSEKNFGRSLQLAVYASTPKWIAGILLLLSVKMTPLIFLVSLYAIYLLATGIPVLKKTPKDKVAGYVAVTIVVMIAISILLALILTVFLGLFFFGNVGFRY